MAMTDGITPVVNVGNEGGGLFGGGADGGGLWVFFLFFLLAWGGNGLGGFGGNAGGATNMINNDFMYTNLNQSLGRLTDGVTQGFAGVNNGLCNLGYETLSNFKDLSAQNASCCCETNRNIDAVRYENAKNTCDIITANNANTDRILGYLTNQEIQTLRDQLQSANLALSNTAQTQNIINTLRPVPQPAYITCSPYTSPLTTGACGC